MVNGMATTSKLTITLPDDQLEQVRARVASGHTPSVSAFVKHAVKIALEDADDWERTLEEALEQTGGPLTDKEKAWVDSLLEPPSAKRKQKKRRTA
jgi:Arc/MetJ-type ribon-helix-helix transcriptional regulator